MNKPFKILLLIAALLYSGNTTASLVSFSENRSPAIEAAVQTASSVIDFPAIPLRFPASKQAKQVTFLSETLSDSNLKESRKDHLPFSEDSALDRSRVSEALFVSRVINPGFALKKIIYPFHSFF